VVGVNWNVTYVSAKFLGRNGGTTANAVKAVDYITGLKTRHGLPVVATNNSWGGGGYSQALADAISRANTRNILFIAAAGNSGANTDSTPHYPSSYNLPNVISVAAIDKLGARASFSNYGASSVDLGAPGVGVWSTTAYNTYSSYSGTSMATPHVTGAAALYASTHPGASAAQIKNAILSSAIPTSSLSGRTLTGGRLDANAANGF
jgi:subtilisin family serine protease